MVYFLSTQIFVMLSMKQFLRGFGGFYQSNVRALFRVCVGGVFGKKGTAMASPLRGVQGQPNIITCVEQRQKCGK